MYPTPRYVVRSYLLMLRRARYEYRRGWRSIELYEQLADAYDPLIRARMAP